MEITKYTKNNARGFLGQFDPEKIETREKRKIKYYNIPASFDIETTSMYNDDGEKTAFMYIWQFDIDGAIIYGRTVDEMCGFFNTLAEHFNLGKNMRMIIYVHNLSHEFAFICRYFDWVDVFAIDARKVASACTSTGLNFKCSYVLTNMSLDLVAKNLETPMKKLVGDLDYTLIRHPETPLTDAEMAYCVEDVKIVVALIRERIADAEDDITKIPLTATGYVRNAVRKNCLYDYKIGGGRKNKHSDAEYRKIMAGLMLTADEYKINKMAFMGGFTHASAVNVGRTHNNVFSYDITSSYPAVMCSEMYPMSSGVETVYTNKNDFEHDLRTKCMIFKLTLKNIELKNPFSECYISESKCTDLRGEIVNNGRIASADQLTIVITNIDFEIIREIYNFTDMKIGTCYVYDKNYLPGKFIKSIIDFYVNKTRLKGVRGSEREYMVSKQMLNSCYGMTVTDIVRDENIYDNTNGWETNTADADDQIAKYNTQKSRFLFYPWGVFVTAYARRNLFKLILETGDDFIYADTDSVKFLNIEKHIDFIEKYNENITRKIKRCLQRSHIDPALASPVDINGKHHPLGVYDCETGKNGYIKFKTLGAKRYIYTDADGLHITIAGVSKQVGAKYLASFSDPYSAFTDTLTIPESGTGKLTHTYIDDESEGYCIDYLGNTGYYKTRSGVHLEPCTYDLSISEIYKNYIANIQEQYYI